MSDIPTIQFEAVSVALRKANAGNILTLRVHPSEMPTDLWDHALGSRYQVVLVKLNDQDQPDTSSRTPAVSPSERSAPPSAPPRQPDSPPSPPEKSDTPRQAASPPA